ncbi:RNA-binding region-containing protein 3 [Apophysomyces ossiformis]|uniref:RNA-binding region-containing protein 3 n=1 Tax=Apophysomyces ossiformis TaxID=679940 RepID=A0A8H7BVJ2_9FUNG|nr:RNA-binding region-containing protein 3 [Apophysomyces ossiformis]
MHAIATVPRLYVQVLHLMNKMSLAPPFGAVDRTAIPSMLKRKHDDMLASDESELESDDEAKRQEEEEKTRMARLAAIEQKKALLRTGHKIESTASESRDTKRIRIVLSKDQEGEVPERERKSEPIVQQSVSNKPGSDMTGGSGENEEISTDGGIFFSMEHIQSNRMKTEEFATLPAFKSYSPGEPSNQLYIKNLSKQVVQDDLKRLFGRFVWDISGSVGPDDLVIDLKEKKGPLRGQAFITFKDVSIAKTALENTNAYLLHGKPMAVQFKRVKPHEQ